MKLARHEKSALVFLIAAFLTGAALLAYKNIFRQEKIYITKHIPQNIPVAPYPKLNQDSLININTASAQELTALPGIGAKLAERIIRYRSERGSFRWITDLKDVEGIGEAKFDKIKDKITTR